MRALQLTEQGPHLQPHYPAPTAAPGEALIRVRLAGICATDLQLVAGYKGGYRGVLGHEFVGEVVDAPDATTWHGARVVGEINIGCGVCSLCARGLAKHCRRRESLGIIGRDGAFADYLTLPVANLHRVPEQIDDEQAVFAEPLAAALEILEQVHVGPDRRVYVVGDGRLGLLIAQVLALTGCDLTLIGRHAAKLKLVERVHGCETAIADDETLSRLAAGPADVVVEATGSHSGFSSARRLVRPGGILVLKSTFAGTPPDVDLSGLVVDEVQVVGSRCGPFAPALRHLAAGRVRVTEMIEARYSLDDGVAALHTAQQRGILKVLIAP